MTMTGTNLLNISEHFSEINDDYDELNNHKCLGYGYLIFSFAPDYFLSLGNTNSRRTAKSLS